MLPEWLRKLVAGQKTTSRLKSRSYLNCQALEGRLTPSIAYVFTDTTLATPIVGSTGIGNDTIAISNSGTNTVVVNGTDTGVPTSSILAIDLFGDDTGAGENDVIDLSGVDGADFSSLVTVFADGLAGANQMLLNNDNHTISIVDNDGGAGSTVTGPTYFVFFDGFGSMTGGTSDDIFVFDDGTSMSGSVDGNSGNDTLDFFAYSTSVTVNLPGGTSSHVAGGITGFENATGGIGNDLLIGDSNSNSLIGGLGDDVLSTGAGGVDVLDGGAGVDYFNIVPTAGSDTTVSGSADDDTVDFSGSAVGVTIDMDSTANQVIAAGVSFSFVGASEVEHFIGTAFDDVITIEPLQGQARSVNGGAPVFPTLPGDVLNLDLLVSPTPDNGTLTVAAPGTATYSADNYNIVDYTSIETFQTNAPIANLIINASATYRDFRIVRNGLNEEIRDITGGATPGTIFFSGTYSSLTNLTINGTTAETNRVVLDFGGSGTPIPNANANPIPSGSFNFDGRAIANGPTVLGDQFEVAGGGPVATSFESIDVTMSGANSGSAVFTDTSLTNLGTANVANIDGMDLSGGNLPFFAYSTSVNDLSFTVHSAATDSTVEDAALVADGVSRIRSTGAAQIVPTTFPNPANLLQIDSVAAGAQDFRLAAMDAGFAPTLMTFQGDASDLFQLTSPGFLQTPTTGVTLSASRFDMNAISETVTLFQGTGELALSTAAVLTTGDATDRAFSGRISGSGGFIKQGAGKWTLGGAISNTYTGLTTVNAGTLELNKPGLIAVGGALTIGDGLGGNDADVVRLLGASNQIVSSSNVIIHSSGLLDLGSFNQTVGPVTLQSGTSDGATIQGNGGALTLGGSATLNVTGTGAVGADLTNGVLNLGTIGLVAGERSMTIADGAATSDLLINMVTSGTAGVLKPGAGLLEFAANGNNYKGTTTVTGGALRVSGSLTTTAADIRLNAASVVLEGGPVGTRSITGRGVIVNGANTVIRELQALTRSNTTAGITLNTNGSARIYDNVITGNRFGIDANGVGGPAGTRAWIQNNDLRFNFGIVGSPGAGIRVQNTAWVDAGQKSGGIDWTGLNGGGPTQGSQGLNIFGTNAVDSYASHSGAGLPTVSQAVLVIKNTGPNALAGPQGPPDDVYVQNCNFGFGMGSTNYVGIEPLVYHDLDSSLRGFADYATPGGLNPMLKAPPQLYSRDVTEPLEQRSMIRRMRFRFDNFVFIANGALPGINGGVQVDKIPGIPAIVDNLGETGTPSLGDVITTRIGITFDVGTGEFRYDYGFTGTTALEVSGSLVDGRYLLGLDSLQIRAGHPTLGPTLTLPLPAPSTTNGSIGEYRFHRLFGDFDGMANDGRVTSADQAHFLTSLGSRIGNANYRAYLDFDNDGDVDGGDYTQFQRRLNRYNMAPLKAAGDL